jgi:hypothetical protein
MLLRRKPTESIIERLEREGNDDFRLLDELGPGHFGLEHLLELREKSRTRIVSFHRRQKLAMTIGAAATGWIALAFVTWYMGYIWLAFAAFGIGAFSFTAFITLVFVQQQQFGTKGTLEYTQRMIEEELRRRAGKMPQKPRPK